MKKEIQYQSVMTVAQAAVMKGIHNAHQLHLATGISIPRSKKLWDGEGTFKLSDIDKLCNNLPCKIKDLIKLVPVSTTDKKKKKIKR